MTLLVLSLTQLAKGLKDFKSKHFALNDQF